MNGAWRGVILLVEDDADEAELALNALERSGLADEVVVAGDGTQALSYLFGDAPAGGAAPAPRLILLDLKLPKLGGLEVLERIRADARTKLIPVVILSSSKLDGDVHRSYELGANSYVVKPVDFERFSSSVAELGRYWLTLNQRAEA